MKKLIALAALPLLAGACADTGPTLVVNRYGTPYPHECRRDLANDVGLTSRVKIQRVPMPAYAPVYVPRTVDERGKYTIVMSDSPQPVINVYGFEMSAQAVELDNLQIGLCKVLQAQKRDAK